MSLETWKKEFYPTKPTKRMSKVAAIQHALKKWEGLRPANLKKHGMKKNIYDNNIYDVESQESFDVDDKTCSLCVKYLDENEMNCPLYQHLGTRCDNYDQPYIVWSIDDDPKPMIVALKKTLEENS